MHGAKVKIMKLYVILCKILAQKIPNCGSKHVAIYSKDLTVIQINGWQKGKVHPRTGHKAPGAEYRYSSTLSLTSALYLLEKEPVSIFTGWVDPRV